MVIKKCDVCGQENANEMVYLESSDSSVENGVMNFNLCLKHYVEFQEVVHTFFHKREKKAFFVEPTMTVAEVLFGDEEPDNKKT